MRLFVRIKVIGLLALLGAFLVGSKGIIAEDFIPEGLVEKDQVEMTANGFTFNGLKEDYAIWVRDNHGAFNINDDDGECSPLVNDALLWLAFGDGEAKSRYRARFLNLKRNNYGFPGNGQRQFADVMESYLVMRGEGTFTSSEQRELEDWFVIKTRELRDQTGAKYQAVGAGMAAVAGYVLDTSTTKDYWVEVDEFWGYAQIGQSFDTGWSPTENSGHYVSYLMMTEFRIARYWEGGVILDSPTGKQNFAHLITWLLKTYPHNGDAPSYGRSWGRSHLKPIFNILHAGAYYLKDYDPGLAGMSKWLANKMFEYNLTNNQETLWTNHPAGRFESSPIYIWWFVDDSQEPINPESRFGSYVVNRALAKTGGGGWDYSNLENMFDKVVLRDGWGDESLFVLLEPASWSNKYLPYANSITQIVYGTESFSTDHTSEGNSWWGRLWWPERNVAYPEVWWDLDVTRDAELISFTDTPEVTTSVTKLDPRILPDPPGNLPADTSWTRTIKLYKTGDRRIEVIDDLPPNISPKPHDPPAPLPGVYWHFQGWPDWKPDGSGVVLHKNGYKLEVSWNSASTHQTVDTVADCYYGGDKICCCRWGWGYVGNSDHEIRLYGQRHYVTTFRPVSNVIGRVYSLNSEGGGDFWSPSCTNECLSKNCFSAPEMTMNCTGSSNSGVTGWDCNNQGAYHDTAINDLYFAVGDTLTCTLEGLLTGYKCVDGCSKTVDPLDKKDNHLWIQIETPCPDCPFYLVASNLRRNPYDGKANVFLEWLPNGSMEEYFEVRRCLGSLNCEPNEVVGTFEVPEWAPPEVDFIDDNDGQGFEPGNKIVYMVVPVKLSCADPEDCPRVSITTIEPEENLHQALDDYGGSSSSNTPENDFNSDGLINSLDLSWIISSCKW